MQNQSDIQARLAILQQITDKQISYKKQITGLSCYLRALGVCLLLFLLGVGGISLWWGTILAWVVGLLTLAFFVLLCSLVISFFESNIFKDINSFASIQSDIKNLKTQLELLDEQQALLRSTKEQYKQQIPDLIRQFQRQANAYRRLNNVIQTIIILFSLLISGITSGLTRTLGIDNNFFWLPWIAPILSFSISFLTSIVGFFKFRERGFNLQQTADAIELEYNAAHLGILNYKKCADQNEVLTDLAERVERLKDEQRKRQQQLEQASEPKPGQ